MRIHWPAILIIACAIATSLSHADDPTTNPANSDGPDIGPLASARMQWAQHTMRDVYDAYGVKGKWDASVHRAMRAAERLFTDYPHLGGDEWMIINYATISAYRAGCRDPMLLYLRGRAMKDYGLGPAKFAKVQEGMADGFRQSHYPAIRKFFGLMRQGQLISELSPQDDKAQQQSHEMLDEAMTKHLPEALADRDLPVDQLITMVLVADEAGDAADGGRQNMQSRLLDAIDKSPQPRSAVLTAQAVATLLNAWGEPGPEAPARIQDGHDMLKRALGLDPKNFEAAEYLLMATLRDGTGVQEVEDAFRQATAIDPHESRPYLERLKWMSPEEQLDFGRKCAAEQKWSAMAPMILVDAHWSASCNDTDDPKDNRAAPHRKYFRDNLAVWDELKPIFDRYFQGPETSEHNRTRYAVICAYSGKWAEADRVFQSMDRSVMSDTVMYDYGERLNQLIHEASEKAKSATQPTTQNH